MSQDKTSRMIELAQQIANAEEDWETIADWGTSLADLVLEVMPRFRECLARVADCSEDPLSKADAATTLKYPTGLR